MKNIKETINNNAYLHSCNCPVCKKNISRDYEEKTFFCTQCGTQLHQRVFTEEEIKQALFDEKRTVAKATECPVILCGNKHPKLKLRCFT